MNKTLTELADSIGAGHAAVDEIVEFVAERDGTPSTWRVGLTDEPPQTLYGDDGSSEDNSLIAIELPDVASARYALRELVERNFGGEDDENGPHGRYLYAHPIDRR